MKGFNDAIEMADLNMLYKHDYKFYIGSMLTSSILLGIAGYFRSITGLILSIILFYALCAYWAYYWQHKND